uniref:Uncharacterized protein n=1 Tax=Glossina pallidipes TaxID=7398 RepID=A0A1A9ZT81_GLOPL
MKVNQKEFVCSWSSISRHHRLQRNTVSFSFTTLTRFFPACINYSIQFSIKIIAPYHPFNSMEHYPIKYSEHAASRSTAITTQMRATLIYLAPFLHPCKNVVPGIAQLLITAITVICEWTRPKVTTTTSLMPRHHYYCQDVIV